MEKRNAKYTAYVQTLKEELVPAMGCTEPIALAYGAAQGQRGTGGNAGPGGCRSQRQHY